MLSRARAARAGSAGMSWCPAALPPHCCPGGERLGPSARPEAPQFSVAFVGLLGMSDGSSVVFFAESSFSISSEDTQSGNRRDDRTGDSQVFSPKDLLL